MLGAGARPALPLPPKYGIRTFHDQHFFYFFLFFLSLFFFTSSLPPSRLSSLIITLIYFDLSHFRVLSSWIPRGKATPDRSMRMRRKVCESGSRRVVGGWVLCCAAVWLTSLSSLLPPSFLHSFTHSLTRNPQPHSSLFLRYTTTTSPLSRHRHRSFPESRPYTPLY